MSRNCSLLGVAALFLVLSSSALSQDAPDSVVFHPNQRALVSNLAQITARPDDAPSVANTAVAIVLSASDVRCSTGSEVEAVIAAHAATSLSTLAGKISGRACALNGHSRKLTSTFIPNGSIQANEIIATLLRHQPLLIEWKRNLYVLYGVVYDQRLHSSGTQDNALREFLLIDPRFSDTRRYTRFVVGKDAFADVSGVASITLGD